jgi:hypothetical protein
MTIQRNTETLVVQNSTLWLSAVFGVMGLIVVAAAFSSGEKRLAGPALVTGVCAVLCLSKYTFVLDSTQRPRARVSVVRSEADLHQLTGSIDLGQRGSNF